MKALYYDKDGMFYRVMPKAIETDDGSPLPKMILTDLPSQEHLFKEQAPPQVRKQRTFELRRVLVDGLLGHRAEYEEVGE